MLWSRNFRAHKCGAKKYNQIGTHGNASDFTLLLLLFCFWKLFSLSVSLQPTYGQADKKSQNLGALLNDSVLTPSPAK